MSSKNKKILVFADEFGTSGEKGFGFGVLILPAKNAGRLDTIISKSLPDGCGEIHSVNMGDATVMDLLRTINSKKRELSVELVNSMAAPPSSNQDRISIYAEGLCTALSTAIRKFKKANSDTKYTQNEKSHTYINNIELILDRSEINQTEKFKPLFAEILSRRGHVKAIEHYSSIDSSVSRLLQAADMVAYGNALKTRNKEKEISDACGIWFT